MVPEAVPATNRLGVWPHSRELQQPVDARYDLTDARIGNVLVLSRNENDREGNARWNCRCLVCDRRFIALGYRLRGRQQDWNACSRACRWKQGRKDGRKAGPETAQE